MSVFDSHSSDQLSGAFETEANSSLEVKQANFAFLSSMERGNDTLPPSRKEENIHEDSEVDIVCLSSNKFHL
jgi:hypothetical protein